MSIQAMVWVLEHSPTKGAERLILLSLANHAGANAETGEWECWPGIGTIQREANMDRERTVKDCLTAMESAGIIVRVINGAPDQRIPKNRRPNLYRIVRTAGVSESDTPARGAGNRPAGVSDSAVRGVGYRRLGVSLSDTQTIIEPSVEPSVEPNPPTPQADSDLFGNEVARSARRDEKPKSLIERHTATFLAAYPESQPASPYAVQLELGRAVKRERFAVILDGLERWKTYWVAAGKAPEHIQSPKNWLKERNWMASPPAVRRSNPGGRSLDDRLGAFIERNGLAGEAS
jgi:hypothetical protein